MERPTCKTCICFEVYRDPVTGAKVNGFCHQSPTKRGVPIDYWCAQHQDFPAYVESLKGPKPKPYQCPHCGAGVTTRDGREHVHHRRHCKGFLETLRTTIDKAATPPDSPA